MAIDKTVISGRAHGRGGPPPAISNEQREAAARQIAEAPHGEKGKKRKELAALLGVHPNTLVYKPKNTRKAA